MGWGWIWLVFDAAIGLGAFFGSFFIRVPEPNPFQRQPQMLALIVLAVIFSAYFERFVSVPFIISTHQKHGGCVYAAFVLRRRGHYHGGPFCVCGVDTWVGPYLFSGGYKRDIDVSGESNAWSRSRVRNCTWAWPIIVSLPMLLIYVVGSLVAETNGWGGGMLGGFLYLCVVSLWRQYKIRNEEAPYTEDIG